MAENIPISAPDDILGSVDNKQADNDLRHVYMYLSAYDGSKQTFNSYRRDMERLIMWCWYVEGVTLKDLRTEHIRLFLEFVKSPPKDWIMDNQANRFIYGEPNPNWRPFRYAGGGTKIKYKFSDSAYKAMLSTFSSFYLHVTTIGYMDVNPIQRLGQKNKYIGPKKERKIRRLSILQMQTCYDVAEQMANENPNKHERTRYIIHLMLGLYLRVSEVIEKPEFSPTMGDFYRDHHQNWWFNVGLGKGRKERDVATNDDVIAALKRYREFLGLSPLPSRGDQTPLIPKVRGTGSVSSDRQIRRIMDDVFKAAKWKLEELGEMEEAESLLDATLHWLRHTGISEDAKVRPISHVRDDAGHNDIKTTSLYIDSDRLERANSRKS